MAIEIERKFLLLSEEWRTLTVGCVRLRQAYLGENGGLSTRVRIDDANAATLTIKSRKAGLRRLEFEFPIPVPDAEALLARGGAAIQKIRHYVPWRGLRWEIDVFEGNNAGLVIAEIELGHELDTFELPAWLGAEVTHEERFYNSNLAKYPFRAWPGRSELGSALAG